MKVTKYSNRKRPWAADYTVINIVSDQKVEKRKRCFFLTKSEAERYLEQMILEYQAALKRPHHKSHSLAEAAQLYLDQHFVRKSKSYKVNEAQRLEYWMAVLGEHRKLEEILPHEIDDVLNALLDAGRAHTTVSKYRALFANFWKFCMKRQLVQHNIVLDVIEVKKRPKRIVKALTEDECNALMAHMSLPARRCFLLLLHLGVRAGELFGGLRKTRRPMMVEDVDWEHDAVHIFSNEAEGYTKGYAERWVPLDDVSRAIFEEAGSGFVVGDADFWWFRHQLETAAERCGIGHANMHQLRHTFCSMQLAAGIPEHVVSAWLGHKDSTITKRYSHLNRVLSEEYRNKILIGESALALVPRNPRIRKHKTPDFALEIKGFTSTSTASPTGFEPVYPP